MDIFITICWILLIYLLAGFTTYLIICWYEYKFNNITYNGMDSLDYVIFALWPFILIGTIFRLFAKGFDKFICTPIRMTMYKMMDKAKEKKNAKLREMHRSGD